MDEQNTEHRPLALFELLDESGIGLIDSSAGLLDGRERRLVVGAAISTLWPPPASYYGLLSCAVRGEPFLP